MKHTHSLSGLRNILKKHKIFVFLFLTILFGIMGSIVAFTIEPYTHELTFKEYSTLGVSGGSVIPASCVSGVHTPHPYDINYDVTIDSGCQPICATGQTVVTTDQFRCFYTVTLNVGDTQNTYYGFSGWQDNTLSSCPATTIPNTENGQMTYFFNAGSVQTKKIYSCVGVNINVQ